MTERDFLIEQCLMDAYCERTGEQLDEGWWDDMKAGVSGAWAGAKQKIKNAGKRISNFTSNTGKALGNTKKMVGALGSGIMGNADAAKEKLGSVEKMDKLSKGTRNAGQAKNWARVQTYAKSVKDVLNSLLNSIKAAGAEPALEEEDVTAFEVINKLCDTVSSMSFEEFSDEMNAQQQPEQQQPAPQAPEAPQTQNQNPSQPQQGAAPQAVEQQNASYDPRLNSKGQRAMLDMLR
jgi:hypothetical protein